MVTGSQEVYQILNLDEGTQDNHLDLYLTACLLTFYQQQRLFQQHGTAYRPFNIEKPLWIFVGGASPKRLPHAMRRTSLRFLRFLARYVAGRYESINRIERVLNQGLVTATGKKPVRQSL